MDIINKDEIDTFCWDHRDNGCDGIKGDLLDEHGLRINMAWRNSKTGEEVKIKYRPSCEEKLRVVERHRDILAMHMAEVKAISDGCTQNTLNDVIEHCLEEINNLNL